MNLIVKSTMIDWQAETLEIITLGGDKHTLRLDKTITVTMVGFPDREQKTMQARSLGQYMSRGYIIEQIDFEEG